MRVGHVTIHDGEVHTGVTAIIPHTGDVFHEKCLAGAHVINGFGKSIGLVQVQELGTLESPILLTNTLSVGTVSTALVEYMLERNDDIGLDAGTVNSLVMECNDARLSDIRGLHITKEHARAALAAASETFAEGDVGARRHGVLFPQGRHRFRLPALPSLWRDLHRGRLGHDQFRHPPGPQGRGGLCR